MPSLVKRFRWWRYAGLGAALLVSPPAVAAEPVLTPVAVTLTLELPSLWSLVATVERRDLPCGLGAPREPQGLGPGVGWASPPARRLPLSLPGASVIGSFGSLRAAELEDQKRVAVALDRMQYRLKPSEGAQSNLLDGDVVGVATLAARALSLNVGRKRARPGEVVLEQLEPQSPAWTLGVGLGRMGLRWRSEW